MVFTDIIKLRDKLSDIAYDNNVFTTLAAGVSNPDIGDSSVNIDGIMASYDSDDATISFKTPFGELLSFAYADLGDHLSDVIPDTSTTISDFMGSCSSTGDIYASLAMVTQKFSYSERIHVDTLNDIIDRSVPQNSLNYDVAELKDQLLAVSNNDGYVTSRAWLTTLKTWFDSCKAGADSRSTKLDETAPDKLAALYNVVANVLSLILDTILNAVSIIFGGIVTILGAAFSRMFSSLSSYFDDQITINPDAPNFFVKGVTLAHEGNDSTLQNYTQDDYSINFIQTCSVGFFFWQGNTLQNVRMNAYVQPKYDIFKLVAKLKTMINNGYDGLSGQFNVYHQLIKITKISPLYETFDDCVIDSIDEVQMMSDPGRYVANIYASEFVRQLSASPIKVPNSDHTAWINPYWEYFTSSYGGSDIFRFLRFAKDIVFEVYNFNEFFHSGSLNYANAVSYLGGYLNYMYEKRNSYISLDWIWSEDYASDFGYTGPINPIYTSCTDGDYVSRFGRYYSQVYDDNTHISNVVGTGFYLGQSVKKANSLPSSFFASVKAFNRSEAIAALVLITMAATAAAVVTLKVSKAMRLKKIEKQTLRSKRIEDARKAWEDDPENKQLLKAYAKEVDRFNRLGRMFGWGTYDAANQWIDTDTGGSCIPDLSAQVVDSYKQTKLLSNPETGNSYISEIVEKLDLLISLIR